MDQQLNVTLATSPTPPDVITIHAGTNDCDQGATTTEMVDRMNSLLNNTHTLAPLTAVYLATVVNDPASKDCTQPFNAKLPAIVGHWKTKGMRIELNPMQEWTGVCVDDPTKSNPLSGLCCSGQIHPNSAGYLRMASSLALTMALHPPKPLPLQTGRDGSGGL
jgi:lysophospholipase L1-like esterase